MIRTAIQRTAPDVRPKPAKGPRSKLCSCCRKPFLPMTPMGRACSIGCAIKLAEAVRQAVERKTDRARKQALKTRQDWIKEAQVAFNAFVRERDAKQPCICCGRTSEKQYLTGTNWDCGHYRSTGSAPHLRFNEDNAHRQLTICNRHGAGRAVDYRIGLIARIGLACVEALEADQTPRKWTVEELQEIKRVYKAKTKALKGSI